MKRKCFWDYFWALEMKDQLRCKTAVSMIMTGVGVVELLILNLFL